MGIQGKRFKAYDTSRRIDKNEDTLSDCPKCGSSAVYGRCARRKCDWKSKSRIIRDALASNSELPSQFISEVILTREVCSEQGAILLREYRCPSCCGKGWGLNWNDVCQLCHGHGCIVESKMILHYSRKVGL